MNRSIRLMLIGFILISFCVVMTYYIFSHQETFPKDGGHINADASRTEMETSNPGLSVNKYSTSAIQESSRDKTTHKEKYRNLDEIMKHWEDSAYPPYYAGHYKSSENRDIIGLTDLSQDVIDEVSNLLLAPEQIQFVYSPYSYDELLFALDRFERTIARVVGETLYSHIHGYGIQYKRAIDQGESSHIWGIHIDVDFGFENQIEHLVKSYYGDKIINVSPGGASNPELDSVHK